MELSFKGTLEKLTWKQVREDVTKVNPKFAKLIDDLSPSDKYWIAKVTYPYGSMVMKRALLQLPNPTGDIVPITDVSIPAEIREGLDYNLNSNPVSLVLENKFEIFLPLEDRTIPLSGLIQPGTTFGAWRVLNPKYTQHPIFIWDMTAGARSVFMLPKITELKRHMQLKKSYYLTADVPRSLTHHWEIFRQLTVHPNFKQDWNAEILYFSKQWFKHLDDDKWKPFYYHFHDSAWGVTEIWRNQYIWNLVFSLILKKYEGRPSAYVMDTVKYLLYVAMGSFPAFVPIQNSSAGPFKEIQRIYTEEYELKNYPPIIMQPEIFNMYDSKDHPVYYSLQFPNASEFKPNSRERASIVSDLHDIRILLMLYEENLLDNKLNIAGTALSDVFSYTKYDFFHNGVTLHRGMRDSVDVAKEDKRFLTTIDGVVHKNFPETSLFLKGCIRLSNKELG